MPTEHIIKSHILKVNSELRPSETGYICETYILGLWRIKETVVLLQAAD